MPCNVTPMVAVMPEPNCMGVAFSVVSHCYSFVFVWFPKGVGGVMVECDGLLLRRRKRNGEG